MMANTEQFTFGEYEYALLEDGTVRIVKYLGGENRLCIPEALGGHAVTGIDRWAFVGCRRLWEVVLPDSLVRICGNPFSYCENLTDFIVSDTHPALTVKDGMLFSRDGRQLLCRPAGLEAKDCAVPDGTEIIGDDAFAGCRWLWSVTLPESVRRIGHGAFNECRQLMSVVAEEGVTEIGSKALYGCQRLMHVSLPDSLACIGTEAFKGCKSLERVVLPEGLKDVGAGAFSECPKLKEIVVSDVHPAFSVEDGVLIDRQKGLLMCCPAALETVHYTVPQGVRAIADLAFSGCGALESVSLPLGVTEIGRNAFEACWRLKEVVLPEGLKTIGSFAFSGCDSLECLTLPESVERFNPSEMSLCGVPAEFRLPRGSRFAVWALENLPAPEDSDGGSMTCRVLEDGMVAVARPLW